MGHKEGEADGMYKWFQNLGFEKENREFSI